MRRMGARFASVFVHTLILAGAALFAYRGSEALPPQEARVFINPSPVYFPFESTGPDGGGGGGGGKMEKLPASGGRMPDTTRVQLVPPDPADPQPLIPAEDLMAATPSVQMPIDIFQDQSMPIGDIEAPPNDHGSSGPGSGGGIGSGFGTGIGSGTGPGVGPGSGGGMGGGSGGGIGSGVGPYVVGGGVRPPVPLAQPLPRYTEDARKARVEGLVLIQAVVRRDGSVDSFKVIRGLGYGLDESAISTIATRWRFKPGTLNGVPVDVQANIEVSFRLY
jgi:TonB family protein